MRTTALILVLLALSTPAFAADLKPPAWGEAKNGLRTRLIADKQTFPAGEPIMITLEMENVGNTATEFAVPHAPEDGLTVLDAAGKPVPFLLGLGQLQQNRQKIDAGKTLEINAFDLAQAYYLRKPGRYSVQLKSEFASAPFEFEVTANPAADADGDPIGKLLPLVKKNWWLSGSGAGQIQPGKNHAQVAGRYMNLMFNDTGSKRDTGIIYVWLADEKADQKADDDSHLPAGKYLGKASRWQVYFATDANAEKAWPTAGEDIVKALQADKK
jgi:hypothetical protein